MSADTDKVLLERWGISLRTLGNWRAKGETVGEAPPLEAEDPTLVLEWYRRHYGREPGKRVKEAARAMKLEAGEAGAETVPEVTVAEAPAELIGEALERLGLSRTLARLVQEEEKAYVTFQAAQEAGTGEETARRRWKDLLDAKRAVQKTDDAVMTALELLKGWVLKELEPMERERKKALEGRSLGVKAREELLATRTEQEWVRVWDRWVSEGLGMVSGE